LQVGLGLPEPIAVPVGLCAVHGSVCALDQGFAIQAVPRIDRDADARTDFHFPGPVAQAKGRCDGRNNLFRDYGGILRGVDAVQDDDEFIASESGHGIGVAYLLAESCDDTLRLAAQVSSGTVIYRSKVHLGLKRNFQVMPGAQWLELLCKHVSDRYEQLVRYVGWYSGRSRGARKAKGATAVATAASGVVDVPGEYASRAKAALGAADPQSVRSRPARVSFLCAVACTKVKPASTLSA